MVLEHLLGDGVACGPPITTVELGVLLDQLCDVGDAAAIGRPALHAVEVGVELRDDFFERAKGVAREV